MTFADDERVHAAGVVGGAAAADDGQVPTHDPYESTDPEDFEPVARPRWMLPAAWVCLVAALLLVVLSI